MAVKGDCRGGVVIDKGPPLRGKEAEIGDSKESVFLGVRWVCDNLRTARGGRKPGMLYQTLL